MAPSEATQLAVAARTPSGSRSARRMRRDGRVLGVVYGGDSDPVPFDADAREVRHALAAGGAVIEVSVDGASVDSVVVKDQQRHPVRGDLVHLDLLRVRLDVAIEATTVIDLVGADDSPGVKEGGVLDQTTREITIEALPNDIPESIQHDVSEMEINDTLFLSSIKAPPGVSFIDDLEETVVATLSPPRVEEEPEEIEEETELVGEDGEPIEAPEGEAPAEDAGEPGGDDAGDGGDE